MWPMEASHAYIIYVPCIMCHIFVFIAISRHYNTVGSKKATEPYSYRIFSRGCLLKCNSLLSFL